jgi:nucleoside-diphosphate-sugar epimerase
MKNLIIGNTSQLSHFFPNDYEKISSRDVNIEYLKDNKWDSVYLTFAEQRTSMNDVDFITPNYTYTKEIIDNLVNSSKRIVVYGTCELWNNYVGEVSIENDFNYIYQNHYCLSKNMLVDIIKIKRNIDKWKNVIINYPFNFNSTYRTKDFLFGKIFDSIINKKKIEIGDTYFYRDLVHTKYIVERSLKSTEDEMIGSGRLHFVNDFIRDLYKHFDMDYEEYVKETKSKSRHSQKLFYSKQDNIYTYDMLLNDTIQDIKIRLNN